MIRKPLRPLASILRAREAGENPDEIEHANIRARHEEMRDESRVRAESRLLILTVLFFFGFGVIGARMGVLAQSEPSEPRADAAGAAIVAQRADIVDRHGRILATNFETHSLYAQPPQMVEPERTAEALVEIFPDLDVKRLKEDFTGKRKFLWVKMQLSPEQR
ncbi:MAG: penicillin-binding protein 2, partial [Pseudomonadota bacterium]